MNAAVDTSTSPIQLDLSLCKACGICIDLCPEQVFDRDALGEPVVARAGDCSQCLLCELHCPDFAIEVRRRGRKGAAAAGAPALTRDDLAAARGVADEHADCSHDDEGASR